ncbi:mycothiol system anti-sigma-R factor [Actinomyces haliotis]|uniref:mycothiol system anti-sigma-R factor n=1 Tax=Actinomyces haliotis TaxID=1280843 RepID=UPI0018902083|nr:mycothiol system anti-sigma-R factor [Actinomyces haliotis]
MRDAGHATDHAADGGCSCSEARAHLEAFLDHECDGDLSERLAAHVATCSHCAKVADAEVHLREILRSRCAEQAPSELRARVLGRLSVMRATSTVTTVTSGGSTTTVRRRTVSHTEG